MFAGSPVKRTGRDRFVRNVLIALGNSGDAGVVPAACARLVDDSPLVRAMAVWALLSLTPPETFAEVRDRHLAAEDDEAVRAEWRGTAEAPGLGARDVR